MFLDRLSPTHTEILRGCLGLYGLAQGPRTWNCASGRHYENAIGVCDTSLLRYELKGYTGSFHFGLALDDRSPETAQAQCAVRVDGRIVASIPLVRRGQPLREFCLPLQNARTLELLTEQEGADGGIALWARPRLSSEPLDWIVGPLGEVLIPPPDPQPLRRCIAAVVAPMLHDALDWTGAWLNSLRANGQLGDIPVVVFTFHQSPELSALLKRYNAREVACKTIGAVSFRMRYKSVAYALGSALNADQVVYLDTDTLVLDSLQPLFEASEVCDGILMAREDAASRSHTLADALASIYSCQPGDLSLLPTPKATLESKLVYNAGVYAAKREALLGAESLLRTYQPHAMRFELQGAQSRNCTWREQFIWNRAVLELEAAADLNRLYNLQLHKNEVECQSGHAFWRGQSVKVLHYNGLGKIKAQELQNYYRVQDALMRKRGMNG